MTGAKTGAKGCNNDNSNNYNDDKGGPSNKDDDDNSAARFNFAAENELDGLYGYDFCDGGDGDCPGFSWSARRARMMHGKQGTCTMPGAYSTYSTSCCGCKGGGGAAAPEVVVGGYAGGGGLLNTPLVFPFLEEEGYSVYGCGGNGSSNQAGACDYGTDYSCPHRPCPYSSSSGSSCGGHAGCCDTCSSNCVDFPSCFGRGWDSDCNNNNNTRRRRRRRCDPFADDMFTRAATGGFGLNGGGV